MMKILKILMFAVLFIIVLGFGLLNHQSVTVNYYIGEITLTSGFSLILAFVLGGLFGMILGFVRKKR